MFLFLSGQTSVSLFSSAGLVYSKLVGLGLIFFFYFSADSFSDQSSNKNEDGNPYAR